MFANSRQQHRSVMQSAQSSWNGKTIACGKEALMSLRWFLPGRPCELDEKSLCFYMLTVQLTCTGDPSIGFIYPFHVQIVMNIQHPRLLAQARQKSSSSHPAQDGIQRQASSKHSRENATHLIPVER